MDKVKYMILVVAPNSVSPLHIIIGFNEISLISRTRTAPDPLIVVGCKKIIRSFSLFTFEIWVPGEIKKSWKICLNK
jgi:hypothetical protein